MLVEVCTGEDSCCFRDSKCQKLYNMSGCYHVAPSTPTLRPFSSFCNCREKCCGIGKALPCACGENEKAHDWLWDVENKRPSTRIELEGREVLFHPVYSSGTAGVKGNKPFLPGYVYYWEIKVLTQLYGTDVMIGVGTNKVDFGASSLYFCSLLGSDGESWGYSYHGFTQHGDVKKGYAPPFGQGSIIGVYLDMWTGTLEFYLNRRPLGIAYRSLQDKILYPMMSSTAAKSRFRLIFTTSCPSSLQLLCLRSLSKKADMVKEVKKVPYLRRMIESELWWLFPPENVDYGGTSKNCAYTLKYHDTESESQDETDSDDDFLVQRLKEYVTNAPASDQEKSSETCCDPENCKQENRKRRFLSKDSVPTSNLRTVDERRPKNGKFLCNVCDVIY